MKKLLILLVVAITVSTQSCIHIDLASGSSGIFDKSPEVATNELYDITSSSATTSGEIIDHKGYPISSKGVVWSTFENPTVSQNEGRTNEGRGDEDFTSKISNLTPNTTYFVRAYAINREGTSYGEEQIFTTKNEQ